MPTLQNKHKKTQTDFDSVMKERSFSLHSISGDYSQRNYLRRCRGDIVIHATVQTTPTEAIRLEFIFDRWMGTMQSGWFAFGHPDFDSFFDGIHHYAKVCKNNPYEGGEDAC